MNSKKIIRITGGILIALLILVLLIIGLGNFALDSYLNADGRKDLTKYLPINGTATYEHASVRLFRSFPDISIRLEGVKLEDSLAATHGFPPISLKELNVDVRALDLREKHIEIKSVDLDGLTLNLFNGDDGYSNIASLIRKKAKENNDKNNKASVSLDYENTQINITNVNLNKIDKIIGQRAYAGIDKILLNNSLIDSSYHLVLEMDEITIAELPVKPATENPIYLSQMIVKVQLNKTLTELSLKDVQLENGHVHLFNDSLGQSNYDNLFGRKANTSSDKPETKSGMTIAIDGASIRCDGIDFALIDQIKNKHLEAHITKLETELNAPTDPRAIQGADTSALVDLELNVDQLAFNTQKGAYLSQSIVKGQIEVNIANGRIDLKSPLLLINDEQFNINAALYSDKKSTTTLTIEKADVRTSKVKPLLTQSIQKSISAYDIDGPFYAKANVFFNPGNKDPRVEVDFRVNKKTVTAKGQTIKNAEVSAKFINRLHDDKRQFGEDRRNVRLIIERMRGVFNEFQIESQDVIITSSPSTGDHIVAQAKITGQAASVSKFLNHDRFNFQDGLFSLTTDINGSLNHLDELIAGTNVNLTMEDLEVHYPEGNAKFPFRILELNKVGEKTTFHIKGYTEHLQRPFHIEGDIDRVESLIFPGASEQLQTEAKIRASSVSWEGVIGLFGKDGIFSSVKRVDEQQAKRSMKQTLSGIQQSFHPVVSIAIDTVYYSKNIQLFNFNTGLKFDDERTLVLEKTTFKIDKSNITLDGEVNINQLDFTKFDFDIELNHLDLDALMPKFDYFGVHLIKQIYDQPDNLSMKVKLSGELDDNAGLRPESINADITYESFAEYKFSGRITLKANPTTKKVDVVFGHSGHPRNFNHLLETDAYRFDKGWYTISFNFDDNFESIAQMVEESTFNLTIDDAEVYMTELGFTIPLTRIELASIKNKAFYHILLQSDSLHQEVSFDGVVNNIRHFAFKDTDEPYEVELEISSPRIDWSDLIHLFAIQEKESSKGGKALKESLTKVLKDFNPNVKLKVDTLHYSKQINFNDIHAHAYMENNILNIDSAIVSYGASQIQVNVEADMGQQGVLPFHMKLNLSNIDIGQTLRHFDYFNVKELREAKQIEGHVWFDLDMKGEMDVDNNGFITEKTDAKISVALQDVVIEDLPTIDNISIGLGFDRRLEVLLFAPLRSNLNIKGRRIEVALTEVQTNSIHAFVEGAIDRESSENLWISVPLRNLKRPNLETVSEKTGYEEAGRKIYLQWITSQDEDNGSMKVYLRKKKFFQERFKARQFRAYKRINRRARKKLRREERLEKRKRKREAVEMAN